MLLSHSISSKYFIKDELPLEARRDIADAWCHANMTENMKRVLHLTVNEWIEKLNDIKR